MGRLETKHELIYTYGIKTWIRNHIINQNIKRSIFRVLETKVFLPLARN